jgi:CBS domain-containing protein
MSTRSGIAESISKITAFVANKMSDSTNGKTRREVVIHEITGFLRGFPPFDTAADETLETVEKATEIEFFPVGSFVLRSRESSSEHAYVLRTGHAELIDGGRVIDVVGPGDVVGLPSMLTDLPPGLDVRAAEDLLVYRVDADAMLPLLSGRSGLRFVAENVRSRTEPWRADDRLGEPDSPPLADIARPAVVIDETVPLGDVVRLMHEQDASSAVVICDNGTLGIVTDHDLRNRVLAAGRDLADAVSTVMTSPARIVPVDATADDAVLVMMTYGVRHLPVIAIDGSLVGVVEEVDLLAAQERTPLRLRRAIARAADQDELRKLSSSLLPGIVEAHRAGRAPDRVTTSYSVLVQSLVSRVIAILLAERGNPPVPFAWLVTGSVARCEMVPSSDLDSLVAWDGIDNDEEVRRWMLSFASDVLDVVGQCGVRHDTNGVRADDRRFSRSVAAWCDAIHRCAADPTVEQGAIYLGALVDATPVWGDEAWTSVRRELDAARQTQVVRRVFGQVAAAHRPPTGFVRDLVIEASGEHRGTLDLKRGGLAPIVDLGRHLAAVCGSSRPDTLGRLEAARSSGVLPEREFDDLREAFLFLMSVRLEHQTALMAEGLEPDDHLAPSGLAGLTRRHLRDALRVTARAQRHIAAGDLPRPR